MIEDIIYKIIVVILGFYAGYFFVRIFMMFTDDRFFFYHHQWDGCCCIVIKNYMTLLKEDPSQIIGLRENEEAYQKRSISCNEIKKIKKRRIKGN